MPQCADVKINQQRYTYVCTCNFCSLVFFVEIFVDRITRFYLTTSYRLNYEFLYATSYVYVYIPTYVVHVDTFSCVFINESALFVSFEKCITSCVCLLSLVLIFRSSLLVQSKCFFREIL